MAKRKRTMAQRRAKRRAYKLAQASKVGGPTTGAGGVPLADPTQDQATQATANNPVAPLAERESPDDSPFWPELSPKNRADAIAAGRGEQLDTVASIRLAIRAVNEQWPIPKDLRERQVFEAYRLLIDPKSSPRERLHANRLLTIMGAANRKIDLPAQLSMEDDSPDGSSELPTVNELLDELRSDPKIIDAQDYRIYQPKIGAADDYAD